MKRVVVSVDVWVEAILGWGGIMHVCVCVCMRVCVGIRGVCGSAVGTNYLSGKP